MENLKESLSVEGIAEIVEGCDAMQFLEFYKYVQNFSLSDRDIWWVIWHILKKKRQKIDGLVVGIARLKAQREETIEKRVRTLFETKLKDKQEAGDLVTRKTIKKYRRLVKAICDETGLSFIDAMRTEFPNFGTTDYRNDLSL